VIGRRPREAGGHIRIRDRLISREHALVTVQPGADAVRVRDLESQNGVWHNGQRVVESTLDHGDILRLGDTLFAVERRGPGDGDDCLDVREIPGLSVAARRSRAAAHEAAADRRPTLIYGASGTGKEFVAGAIHRLSGAGGALVRLNVAAVPANLFESEIFGHVRGAFSGADRSRTGRFREADGGTLVLDEIGELSLELQAKLLRVIEDGVIRPVGGTTDSRVDVKVIASTNADLDDMVAGGRFRADLLARLRHHRVVLAPLGRRRADLMALAAVVFTSSHGRWQDVLDGDAIEALLCDPWHDNLRGLHVALRTLHGGIGRGRSPVASLPDWIRVPALEAESTPQSAPEPPPPPTAPRTRTPDRATLESLLRQKNGNVNAVGRALGRDRKQVYRWLAAAGIDTADLVRYRS